MLLTLKAPITSAADDKFWDIFPNFRICQQTILMKYHALFVTFEKSSKILNCCLLQIIGGALRGERKILQRNYQSMNFVKFHGSSTMQPQRDCSISKSVI